jgi:hypothetical protein
MGALRVACSAVESQTGIPGHVDTVRLQAGGVMQEGVRACASVAEENEPETACEGSGNAVR